MITVSVADAKNRLPELLRAVEAGQRVLITRHGKPVAEIGAPVNENRRNTFSLASVTARQTARGLGDGSVAVPTDFDDIEAFPEGWLDQVEDHQP